MDRAGFEPVTSTMRRWRSSVDLPALKYKNVLKENKAMIIAAIADLDPL